MTGWASVRDFVRERRSHVTPGLPPLANLHSQRWHSPPKIRFAPDSPLEQAGFELPVPPKTGRFSEQPLFHLSGPQNHVDGTSSEPCRDPNLRANSSSSRSSASAGLFRPRRPIPSGSVRRRSNSIADRAAACRPPPLTL